MIHVHVTSTAGSELWTCTVALPATEPGSKAEPVVRVERARVAMEGASWQDGRLLPPRRIEDDPKAMKGFRILATAAREQHDRGGCAAGALYRMAESWEWVARQVSFAERSQRMAANAAVARAMATLLETTPNLSAAGLAAGYGLLGRGSSAGDLERRQDFQRGAELVATRVAAAPGETLLLWATLHFGAQTQLAGTPAADQARVQRWTLLAAQIEAEWITLREIDRARSES